MKKTIYKAICTITVIGYCLLTIGLTTSCNKWLDVLPNNEQVTDNYWKSKEDVEAVITSGYYYLRTCVPTLIKWGELRGGALYTNSTSDGMLQDFNILSTNAICNWAGIYKVIGMANSVILYAPTVQDDTYYEANRNAHLAEAYFLRAYCYLILVKNFRDVPLITEAYVNDKASFDKAKSTEVEVIAQIKSDVETALATGAAKGTYEEEWQTKGRATKWALYALMADACLWSEDYDRCIEYCNMILDATDAMRPAFMTNTGDWYTMFYPGNSNESIFELNWDYNSYQETNNFASLFTTTNSSPLRPTTRATELMKAETQALREKGLTEDGRMGRMLLATYVPDNLQAIGWNTSQQYYIWKYAGTDVPDISGGVRAHQDANFIIYRVAEIILMKAQALTMKGTGFWKEAVRQVNRIRTRAGLANFNSIDTESADADTQIAQLDELELLQEVLGQKELELMAEGKRWYDLLWFGRVSNYKYKTEFISKVVEGNQTTNRQWIQSVLQDDNAWYMPIPQADIEHNKLLEQNPYYSSSK